MDRRRIFWATAPGTEARKREEEILRKMGLLGDVRELKNQAEALGVAFTAEGLPGPDKPQGGSDA